MENVKPKNGPALDPEAKTTYDICGTRPAALNDHLVSKHWVLCGMTPAEFSELHAGSQFDFDKLLMEVSHIMPDLRMNLNAEVAMYCIEFASLVLFTVGPATRSVKEGQRDQCWAMTVPSEDRKMVNTIFVATHKGKPPAISQPTVENHKICLTIKQASLISLYVVAKLVKIICNSEKILLTPLAGAIFCKDDVPKIAEELGMELIDVINMINASAQSGGFYLPSSTCAAAAVCALVATKGAEEKVAKSIVTKTIKQYYGHHKIMDLKQFDVLSKYATGGVPSGMSHKELMARLEENQKVHMVAMLKERSKMKLETVPSNLTFGSKRDDGDDDDQSGPSSGAGAYSKNY